MISIHAPLAGSDPLVCIVALPLSLISIHAPLAGSDRPQNSPICSPCNFNPRSPCGERPDCITPTGYAEGFQSTLPLRGATYEFIYLRRTDVISIHAPLAGSDRIRGTADMPLLISIHAPLAGSDLLFIHGCTSHFKFQSTLPLRGATLMSW